MRQRARRIPDPILRALALDAQQHKWACLEGAAAFATFVARGQRTGIVRLRPLAPGRYPFEGEYHADTAQGVVVAQ